MPRNLIPLERNINHALQNWDFLPWTRYPKWINGGKSCLPLRRWGLYKIRSRLPANSSLCKLIMMFSTVPTAKTHAASQMPEAGPVLSRKFFNAPEIIILWSSTTSQLGNISGFSVGLYKRGRSWPVGSRPRAYVLRSRALAVLLAIESAS